MDGEKTRFTGPELVQIGAKKKPSSLLEKISAGTIADKYFTVGALACFFGVAGFGAHMWLMLNGQQELTTKYIDFKTLHILIQYYLVFGVFILGFTIQAGAKLLGVPKKPPIILLFPLLLMIVGTTCWYIYSGFIHALLTVSASFLMVFFYILRLYFKSGGKARFFSTFLLSFGLLSFSITPYVDLTSPTVGPCIFWLAICPFILTASEQFISGILEGKRLGKEETKILLLLFSISSLVALSGLFYSEMFRVLGCLSIVILSYYIYQVGLLRKSAILKFTPLSIAVAISFIWAYIGSVLLIFGGASQADSVFHIWTTGLGFTLILAVSCQVVGFLSGGDVLKKKQIIFLILFWQLVPNWKGPISNY